MTLFSRRHSGYIPLEDKKDKLQVVPELRRAATECIGSFLVVTSSCIGTVASEVTGDESIKAVSPFAEAFVITALIFTTGQISGAHFNPIVSLGFLLRGVFDWRRFVYYVPSQFLGGIMAGAFVYWLFGNTGDVGATVPEHISPGKALVLEIIMSMLVVIVILNVGTRAQLIGANAGIPIGASTAACELIGGSFTGASTDPARSLGSAVFAGGDALRYYWIYFVGPVLGSVIAVCLMYFLSDRINVKEEEEATGNGTAIEE